MKKKFMFVGIFLVLGFCFAGIGSVLAADITACQGALGDGVVIDEKIPNIVSLIIKIIQIVVPIVLVILGMIDLMKGVTAQKDEEIKKGQQTFIKRLIAAAIVFFVIIIVKLVFSLVADDEGGNMMQCINCFLKGSDACTAKSTNAKTTSKTPKSK